MGNAISVRCVAVNGGHVIEADGSKAIKTQQQSDSKAQQWLVEPKDANHPQEFALKNLANEQYLRAQTGKPYAPCTTGDRQYWAAEPGEAPGSFWLRNLEFADAYLCNCKGLQTANNAVYMWPKQQNWVRALTWYVRDVNAKGFLSLPTSAPNETPEAQKAIEELQSKRAEVAEKEKQLAEREQRVAEAEKRAQELDARASELSKKMNELGSREKELEEQRRELADGKKRAEENEKKEKELAEKEKELAKKEKELAEADQRAKDVTEELERREKEVIASEKSADAQDKRLTGSKHDGDASTDNPSDISKREQELEDRRKQLDAREKDLNQREQQAPHLNNASDSKSSSTSASTSSAAELSAVERENQGLKAELERLRAIVANSQSRQNLPKRTSRGSLMSAGPAVGTNIPRVRPAATLPGGWDPHLLAKFNAGKKTLTGQGQAMRSTKTVEVK